MGKWLYTTALWICTSGNNFADESLTEVDFKSFDSWKWQVRSHISILEISLNMLDWHDEKI